MPRSNGTDLMDRRCPLCEKQFKCRQIRNTHIKLIHQNAGDHPCNKCGKTFSSNINLKIHQRSHMRKKRFRCQICKKQVSSEVTLQLHHQNIHLEKKFKCNTCNRSFGVKANLQRHLAVHSDNRPFKCDQCGKQFKYPNNLKSHLSLGCPATRREASALSANRFLAQSKDPQFIGRVKRLDSRSESGGASYSLRTRGSRPNYRVDQVDDEIDDKVDDPDESSGSPGTSEICGDFQDNESSEEASGPESDEPVGCEDLLHEEEKNGEPDGVEVNEAVERNESSRSFEDPEMIIFNPIGESKQEDEMSVECNTSTGAKLKVVFDVEYVAPE